MGIILLYLSSFTAVVTSLAAGMIAPMLRGITSQHVEPQEQGNSYNIMNMVTLSQSKNTQ